MKNIDWNATAVGGGIGIGAYALSRLLGANPWLAGAVGIGTGLGAGYLQNNRNKTMLKYYHDAAADAEYQRSVADMHYRKMHQMRNAMNVMNELLNGPVGDIRFTPQERKLMSDLLSDEPELYGRFVKMYNQYLGKDWKKDK